MSPVDVVPADVWQKIFLFVATDGPLGPPSGIVPLILTCREMHVMLCGCKPQNSHLYAAIFLDCFDIQAPGRHLGRSLTTSSCRSVELRDRFSCIQRVRRRSHQVLHPLVLTEDLCRCFFMLLESDHNNAKLLFQYAGITHFVLDLARTYLSENQYVPSHPSPRLSFILWLLWLVSSYDELLAEDLHKADELQRRLLPYVISAWIYQDYPPISTPLPDNSSRASPGRNVSPPFTMSIFSHTISFTVPPLSPAAILSFCSRADACLIRYARSCQIPNSNQPPAPESVTRAQWLLTSSVAGLDPNHDDSTEEPSLISPLFSTPSERFDDDWERLQIVPLQVARAIQLPSRTISINILRLLAAISGTWDGRMEYPGYDQYMSLRDGTYDSASYDNLSITSVPLSSCRCQVFYCTVVTDILRTPQDRDSILNAWIPPETEIDITHTSHGDLRIWDRIAMKLARYKLYYPDRRNLPNAPEIRDVIIIASSVSQNPGLDARFMGRVVLKDGLIVMTRQGPQTGKEVLRGYIHHGRNFVGRWRTTASPADADSWEGPVIMVRRDEPWALASPA